MTTYTLLSTQPQAPAATNGDGGCRTKHHPPGNDKNFFDEAAIGALIIEWKHSQDVQVLERIIRACRPNILLMIYAKNTVQYETEDELISRVNCKLLRVMDKWDPERGSAFTFISWYIEKALYSVVKEA